MQDQSLRDRQRLSSQSFLAISGATLVFTGILYLLLSLLPALVAASHDKAMEPGVTGFAAFGWLADAIAWTPGGLVAAGLLVQIALGWILGIFTIVAGVRAMRGKRLAFVRRVTIANLFYAPIGSTVGAMLLLGFRRPRIRAQFEAQ